MSKPKKSSSIGAELVKAITGASVHIVLLSNWPDEEGKHCCAVICKDTDGQFSSSKFLHSHLEWEEIFEVLDNPGNMGLS